MDRSLPPTAHRRALARRAGVVLTSPATVAAVALAATLLTAVAAIGLTARALAVLARDGWSDAARPEPIARALAVDSTALVARTTGLTAPFVLAALGAALLATAVLARGLVVPRRAVRNAPELADNLGARAADTVVGLVRAAIAVAATVAFLFDSLPALAALTARTAPAIATSARTLVTSALLHVTIAAVVASVLELALRAGRRRDALRMTVREARDELRETAGDPTLRRRQREASRGDARSHLLDAVVLIVGDDTAVAVGWHPGQEPRVLARGRGVSARALRTAARARHVPIAIAAALATILDAPGPVPTRHHTALAELLAALGIGPR